MGKTLTRKIVKIDEDRCNGCGACVPSCAEGAIAVIDGKARLLADNLCDGLGNCLGTCPEDAIIIEERPAVAFDEEAVRQRLGRLRRAGDDTGSLSKPQAAAAPPAGGGCPGARVRMMAPGPATAAPADEPGQAASQLGHWPVQLALVPPAGPIWQDADVLIAADCVAFALPDFHQRLLAGKSLAVACPKLDNVQPYIEKLTRIFADNPVRSITVAHMEVPCCSGIVHMVRTALQEAGREDIPVTDVTVGVDGTIRP